MTPEEIKEIETFLENEPIVWTAGEAIPVIKGLRVRANYLLAEVKVLQGTRDSQLKIIEHERAESKQLQEKLAGIKRGKECWKAGSIRNRDEINKLRAAITKMLDLEAENLEGYDSEIHKTGREALGISEEEYFGTDEE